MVGDTVEPVVVDRIVDCGLSRWTPVVDARRRHGPLVNPEFPANAPGLRRVRQPTDDAAQHAAGHSR